MKSKEAGFKFQPFSKKQVQVLTWWNENSPVKDKDIIIADGSVRAGKTVVMSLSFVMWAMEIFDEENFALCGKTIGSLRRNVLKPLKKMLIGRGYHCKEHRADNYITVSKGNKSNDFYLFGGKDESSQDLIQGLTLAGVLFDEVALMPQSFVNQATARCSLEGAKIWFNCNPDGPYHWFKLEYLDMLEEKNALHLHFTMDDNLSLSEKVKNRYKKMYSGIFYERYILGLWKLAEGLIYKQFANVMSENKGYMYKHDKVANLQEINIGLDFGGAKSGHSFVATGITGAYKELIVLASERWMEDSGQSKKSDTDNYCRNIDPDKLGQLFVDFVKKIQLKYGQIDHVYADSAEQTLIRGIRASLEKNKIFVTVRNARKSEITDRINATLMLMAQQRFFLTEDCGSLIKALTTAVWDADKVTEDVRLDNGSSDIDSLDAFEYSFEGHIRHLVDAGNYSKRGD